MRELKDGEIGLVVKEDGRILQIGLAEWQYKALGVFLAEMSRQSSFVLMGDDYELVLKQYERKI